MAVVLSAIVLGGGPTRAQVAPGPSGASADPIARELAAGRGIAEFERGRYQSALGHLDQADPEQPGTSYYRGLALLALRRAEEAMREFAAIRRRPGAPGEVDLDLGIAQLAAGETEAATATLAQYVQGRPDDAYGQYFLGVALFRARRYDEALLHLERATVDASLSPYLDFYRGLAAYERGDTGYRGFLEQFRSATAGDGAATDLAARLCATTPFAGPAAALTPAGVGPDSRVGRPGTPAGADDDRRWNLALLTGYEYDSNVSLAPIISPSTLGTGFNRPDSRWVIASFGEYRVVQRDRVVVGLIGSTYDTFQFHLNDFNFQDYMGGVYGNLLVRDNWVLGNRYEFHETLLDGRQFATSHRLTPNLSLMEGAFGHTTAYYELDANDFRGLALVPAQIRNGINNAVGLTQAIYLFEGAGRLFLGYRFEGAQAVGDDFDRTTNMITARVEVPLPWKIVANAEFRQFWDDYTHPNSLDFFGRPRSDSRIEVRTGFQQFFTDHLSMRIEYIYANNDSNVENLFGSSFYTFNRHILSTMLIYDF